MDQSQFLIRCGTGPPANDPNPRLFLLKVARRVPALDRYRLGVL